METIKLCDKDNCTGCKSCVNTCIKKCISCICDEEGFEYPVIGKEKCVECGLCVKSCPILSPLMNSNEQNPLCFWGYSISDEIVRKSSSGGLFFVLAEYVIERGGAVVGAEMESTTFKVNHTIVEDIEGLNKLRGSKYVQSDINSIYSVAKRMLQEGRLLLFSGTPCIIAGLYSFLHNKKFENLYTVEVICHGVPSYKFFDTYVSKLNVKGEFDSFSFRNSKIWDFDTFISYHGHKRYLLGSSDFFMRSFLCGEIFREACYSCQFAKLPRVSDLTLGDFWGIDNYVQKSKINRSGNSVILINNSHGLSIWNSVKKNCYYEEVELEKAMKRNSNIYKPSIRPEVRNTIYNDMSILSLKEMAIKYNHRFSLRNYLGFIKRRIKEFLL